MHAVKNSRLYHEGVQSLIIHHLCDHDYDHRKLNYVFKLKVNPTLHLESQQLYQQRTRAVRLFFIKIIFVMAKANALGFYR